MRDEELITRITVDLTDEEIQMICFLIHNHENNKYDATAKKIFEAYKKGESVE